MKTTFYDLETGGLKVGDPIIQIAAVTVEHAGAALKEVDSFECKIVVDRTKCDPKALEINHFNPERWTDAITEVQAVAEFSTYLKEHADVDMISSRSGRPYKVAAVGGYNITGFDTERLSHLFAKMNRSFLPIRFSGQLDVLQGAVWYFARHRDLKGPKNYSQVEVGRYFGFDTEGAHDAMVDVRLCIKIAECLLQD